MKLSVHSLCKTFDGKTVLDRFSCEFPERGVVAVMGRSGVGKTTLLRLLLGLEKPNSGRIDRQPGARFSAVFQEDRLFEQLCARENLRLTTSRTVADIDGALRALALDPENTAPVRTYSGGMKRRVALARGLLYPADALLLDEPFRGLDPETRDQAVRLTLDTWRDRLIILVTHDAGEARLMNARQIIPIEGETGERQFSL